MKKLTSLILALVMALAVAAGASALTGDIYEPGPTTGGVLPYTNIRLKLVESIPGGPGFGLLSLTETAAGKAYFPNQTVYFALEYTTPDLDNISIHDDDYQDPAILMSATNVEFWPGTFALYSISAATISTASFSIVSPSTDTYANKVTLRVPRPTDPEPDAATQYILVGGGIVRGTASGAIRADFAGDIDSVKFFGGVNAGNIPNLLDDAYEEFGGGRSRTIYTGTKKAYIVSFDSKTNPIYSVQAFDANEAPLGTIWFHTDSAATKAGSLKNVFKITGQVHGGDIYQVNDTGMDIGGGGTSSLQFYRAVGDQVEVLSPSSEGQALVVYNALKAVYQKVMGFFGLQYSREGILLPIHFAQKFSVFYGVSNEVRVAVGSSVPTDPDLNLPATGDAAVTAGFVMLALAVAAACGLAYRKVRG